MKACTIKTIPKLADMIGPCMLMVLYVILNHIYYTNTGISSNKNTLSIYIYIHFCHLFNLCYVVHVTELSVFLYHTDEAQQESHPCFSSTVCLCVLPSHSMPTCLDLMAKKSEHTVQICIVAISDFCVNTHVLCEYVLYILVIGKYVSNILQYLAYIVFLQ